MRKSNYLFLIVGLFFNTISFSQLTRIDVVKELNGELYKIALFNIGRSHNNFRNVKRKYKHDLERNVLTSFGLDSISNYGKYTLCAYYNIGAHRSYYYLVIEQDGNKIKYHFIKGFYFNDIVRRLNRILKQLAEQPKLSLLCDFHSFYMEDSSKKTLFSR